VSEQKIIKGRWVVTGDEILVDSAVVVEGDSVVETGDAGTLQRKYPAASVTGSETTAVLPGFVNAHHHSHGFSTIQNGYSDLLLESWILGFVGLRKGGIFEETLLSAANQLRSGVTSLVDVHSGGGTAADYERSVDGGLLAYEQAGIRVAFASGTSTQSRLVHGKGQDDLFIASLPERLRDAAQSLLPRGDRVSGSEFLDIVDARVQKYRAHPLIDVWFAPPGPQWVSDELMCQIAERAERLDTNVQTHCNESFYEKLHGDKFYGRPTVEHLEELGVLSDRFSIAHGVWLTESEIAALARTGAAVSHNPSSNLRLRAGIAPLNAMLESGATVALGMDGTTLNEDEDMFNELRLALRLNRVPHYGAAVPTVEHLFNMATRGGARLMRKSTQIGRLAAGYKADLMVIDLARIVYPWIAPEVNPLELIALRAHKRDIQSVMVNGETVMRDGVAICFDEAVAAQTLAEHLNSQPLPARYAEFAAEVRPHVERWYEQWHPSKLEPYTRYNAR